MPNRKYRFATALFICLACVLNGHAQSSDSFETVSSKTKLINDLKDIYRAYQINHKIADQKELIDLSASTESKHDLTNLLSSDIKSCDSLKKVHFFSDTLNKQVEKCINLTIQNYQIGMQNGLHSAKFKNDYNGYEKAAGRYYNYLGRAYSMERFVNLTEDEYWKLNAKSNYIKSPDFAKYTQLKKTNLKEAFELLKAIISRTKDFQEYSIYQIELADQCEKKSSDGLQETTLNDYKSILEQHKYSIYLFEAWVKWRAVSQRTKGLSKSSDIPNDLYDNVRAQTALTILRHIEKNPTDRMAINEFLLVATHDIIRRFGQYPYGNQSTIEYHELFDDNQKN